MAAKMKPLKAYRDGSGDANRPKPKTDQAKISEVIKELHQAKIKIQTLEKEKMTHIYNRASEHRKEFAELQEMDNNMSGELKSERIKVVQQINKIKGMVKRFQRELQNVKPTPEFVEKLKGIMEETENCIKEFKERQREKFEELLKEERLTSQGLAALEKRMETWNQAGPAVVKQKGAPAPVASQRDILKDLPPEVAAFERFEVEHGGPRGGWDEYDHGTFLKFWNRHKGKGNILQDCVSYIPTKTEEEIKHHILWYKEYLDLKEKKRVAIQKWKERKEVEKEEILDKAVEEEKEKEEIERRKEEMRKKVLDDEARERKAQLNAWKVERELQKAEEQERKLRQELMKAKEQEMAKQKKLELKSKVEGYRELKKQQEEQERLHEQLLEEMEKEARRADPVIIARMHQRDMEKLKKKQELEMEKLAVEKEKERKLNQLKSQVAVKVARDPNRLYQLTEGWKERNKEQGSSGGGQIYQMPHRAVPSWREGLF